MSQQPLRIPLDDEIEEFETLDDMDPQEREQLEDCLERGLRAVQSGDRRGFIEGTELIRRLKAKNL